jgi:hypothetical protein
MGAPYLNPVCDACDMEPVENKGDTCETCATNLAVEDILMLEWD